MNGGSSMKRTHLNPVGLLSLMALPAVLCFVSGERSYLAFLIFLIFIPYFGIKPDEFFSSMSRLQPSGHFSQK